MKWDSLEPEAKALLYCMHGLDVLKRKGIVQGGAWELTRKSRHLVKHMKKVGYKPTDEELHLAMAALVSEAATRK